MSTPPRKTCKRYDEPNQAHFLTFSCYKRRPFLTKDHPCQLLADAIDTARSLHRFDLWAYVFMPEHVHLLIYPYPDTKISAILRAIKQPVTQRALAWIKDNRPDQLRLFESHHANGNVSRHFWQAGGGYDRNLWSENEIHEKVRYIHNNPVERGLAARDIEFKWSSAHAWEFGVDEPLKIDRESFWNAMR